MKIESNKNWTTCLRLNTGDGSPRVFLLNSHFLGSVPYVTCCFFVPFQPENALLISFLSRVAPHPRRSSLTFQQNGQNRRRKAPWIL